MKCHDIVFLGLFSFIVLGSQWDFLISMFIVLILGRFRAGRGRVLFKEFPSFDFSLFFAFSLIVGPKSDHFSICFLF